MAAHEDVTAELHAQIEQEVVDEKKQVDLSGAPLHSGDGGSSNGSLKAKMAGLDPYGEDYRTADGDEPTEYEIQTLRRVGERLPMSSFLVAVVELCERFTYYGCSGLFQNYISNSPSGVDGSPGLGYGHAAATGLNLFFQFFCYITPILGAIISDQYWGKYKTIVFFAFVYVLGLLILWVTSLPSVLAQYSGLGGFVTALVVIGFGTGGIKSNVAPLIADQYQRRSMAIRTEKNGERVIIDPAITYQRIYMIFYGCINIGSLSLLATPYMEKFKGFWTAYLLCFCMFLVGVTVLILGRKAYVVRPPQGSIITDSFKALGMMIVARNTDAAKPSWRQANGKSSTKWDDHFVDELKRALRACKVFTFYPIFWLCYNQFSNNFVSQAAQMNGHGVPNDLMQNFDPISIIVFLPILDKLVYPALRKAGWTLRPIARITIGFWLAALCVAYAAIVQHIIYDAGPCYDAPLACDAGTLPDGTLIPNNVHIAIQTPAYVFIGLSEIFISVTGLEYAYTKSPPSMKSFVQSMYLFTTAIGAALGEAFLPVLGDPQILWMYTGIACGAFVTGFVFWFLFKHYDQEEDKMNQLDKHDPVYNAQGDVSSA